MIIQCPDCKTKMQPKPPEETKAGTKVSITCRCGTKLRFTMPAKPVDKQAERQIFERMDVLLKQMDTWSKL